jgi:acyl dehydratase
MNTSKPPLHLEDLHIGQRFVTGSLTIDAEQIKTFARQFDPQPFHTDEIAAEDSFFRGLAASGWHTASLTMRLMVDDGPKFAGGNVGVGVEVAWPQATRPGDTLTVESEVTAIHPSLSKPDRGIVSMRSETKNQRGEVVQVLKSKSLVMRAPSAKA